VHGTGFGITTSRDEIETGTMDALRSAVATLEQKAPDELAAYRELVTAVAQHVAEAKSGVKPSETDVIAKINEALGVDPGA
jgi:tellurite resistance protein